MSIDWIHFTPWRSLLGGLMIGAAAAMLILYNGRIAGISGVLGGLLNAARGERGWRLAFLAGLVAAQLPLLLGDALPAATIAATPPVLIVAGLLVGLGTR
ncbi:MAG TPA: YeeE/YedE, partial [Janthinobacterium sp.]|nr:YeeE/YedE [Janthinobacterium sp.]